MLTARELREKFDKDLKELQNNCKHEDKSGWMPYMWAPGHFGLPVKVCNMCDLILERQEMIDVDLGSGLEFPLEVVDNGEFQASDKGTS